MNNNNNNNNSCQNRFISMSVNILSCVSGCYECVFIGESKTFTQEFYKFIIVHTIKIYLLQAKKYLFFSFALFNKTCFYSKKKMHERAFHVVKQIKA